MNAPQAPKPTKPVQVQAPTLPGAAPSSTKPTNKGPTAGFLVVVTAILALLLPLEGRELEPYRDSAGIWTVCMGLIAPELIARHPPGSGQKWTEAECEVEERKYVTEMATAMASCLPGDVLPRMKPREFAFHAVNAYNIGTKGWCQSSAARALTRGDHVAACQSFAAYTWITIKPPQLPRGEHKVVRSPKTGHITAYRLQCRDPLNRCRGLPKRRDQEVAGCMAALAA